MKISKSMLSKVIYKDGIISNGHFAFRIEALREAKIKLPKDILAIISAGAPFKYEKDFGLDLNEPEANLLGLLEGNKPLDKVEKTNVLYARDNVNARVFKVYNNASGQDVGHTYINDEYYKAFWPLFTEEYEVLENPGKLLTFWNNNNECIGVLMPMNSDTVDLNEIRGV